MKKLINFFFKREKKVLEKPVLKIKKSIVPTEFEQNFPNWDKHLFTNIKYI